jgi:hypothetical protein
MDINHASIEKADNGFLVCWSEKKKSVNPMEHCGYVDHKEVFLEKDLEKAWDFYKEKKMACLMKEKESSY